MPNKLTVSLGERSYDILIGSGLLGRAGEYIAPVLSQKRVIIITDEEVAKHHLAPLQASLTAAGIRQDTLVIAPGESSKSFESLAALMERILALKPERKTMLVALGGGVVGDLAGFAASILLRGVDFIQIPTTLLAQVDSSVGGKTGINTKQGKNLVGSFHQPRLVLADVAALATLPKRQWLAGYAEIVKYGLINDPEFFAWLEQNGAALLNGDEALLTQAVLTSCRAKAAIVSRDEKEGGARALLNLGHTFGHALEAETGFGDALLHGEAVAIGMCMAFDFSARAGLCSGEEAARVKRHLKTVGLPISPKDIRPDWSTERLVTHFAQDKKVSDGALTFILAHGIGGAFIAKDVVVGDLRTMLAELLLV